MSTNGTPTLEITVLEDERCDRCNAAAKLRVSVAQGGELVFCGHHANKYAENLVKIAGDVFAVPGFPWKGTELKQGQPDLTKSFDSRHPGASQS